MMGLTTAQVMQATGCARDTADGWLPFLESAMKAYSINTPQRVAAFLAQLAHESAGLTRVEENLNYSWQGLMKIWPMHFPTEQIAQKYHRKREAIANRAYANRMGNGPEASGDGYKYRGKGLIQLTGKNNHSRCGAAIGCDLVNEPELLFQPAIAAQSAGWFWHVNGLNGLADSGDYKQITIRINGGTIGLADRIAKYEKALTAFA